MDKGFKFMSIAGDDTTKKADVHPAFALGSCDFLRFATVVVGGMAFKGMSTTVVTPPKAAAWVPV